MKSVLVSIQANKSNLTKNVWLKEQAPVSRW